jgi:hypothetical protein
MLNKSTAINRVATAMSHEAIFVLSMKIAARDYGTDSSEYKEAKAKARLATRKVDKALKEAETVRQRELAY